MPGNNLAIGGYGTKQDFYHRTHVSPRIHASIRLYVKAMDSFTWAVKRETFMEFIARGPYSLMNHQTLCMARLKIQMDDGQIILKKKNFDLQPTQETNPLSAINPGSWLSVRLAGSQIAISSDNRGS